MTEDWTTADARCVMPTPPPTAPLFEPLKRTSTYRRRLLELIDSKKMPLQ